jgi:ADP-ribose pyrophosphatase
MSKDLERGGFPEGTAADIPEVVSSRLVYEGRVVSLRVDEIALPTGGSAVREVVWHPGAVVVIAIDSEEYVYLVRQYRHPIGRYLLELPAGGLEKGEEPLAAAQRELREEVGLEAREWTSLGSFFSSPGFVNEHLHAFLARDLVSVPNDPDDDEDISVVRYSLAGLLEHLEETPDAKTLATICLLRGVTQGGRPNAT